ncbi:MAG: hypothetical protein HYR74_09735 [Candidatus Eisenbacteria bacterium]|nr:hypothetical protein [Candidatus Eisenbacteria bacterium]
MLDAEARKTHDANKRELFDAMRAYHDSELAHKRDAISLLTTLLTAIGAIFAAIIVPSHPIPHAGTLAWSVAAVTSLLAAVIVSATNRKIEEDHKIYANFGDEYVRQCEVLGLFGEVAIGDEKRPVKKRVKIGHGGGYRHTKRIVRSVGIAISTLTVLGAVFVQLSESRAGSSAGATRPRPGSDAEIRATAPPESTGGLLR